MPSTPVNDPIAPHVELALAKQKNRRLFYLFNLLQGFLFSIVNTLLQPYLFSLVQSETIVGLMSTLGQIVMYLPQIWAGKMSDRRGRKLFIGAGYGFFIIAAVNWGFFPQVLWVCVGILLYNFGFGLSDPAFSNFMNENRPEGHSASNFGVMFFLFFGGSVCGNILINLLGEGFDYPFYFQLFMVIATVQLILMMVGLREKPLKRELLRAKETLHQSQDEGVQRELKTSSWKLIWDNPSLRNLSLFFAFDGFLWGIALTTYSAGLLATFPINKEQIAQISLVFNICNVLLQIPAGHVVQKLGTAKSLMWSIAMGFGLFGTIILAWLFRSGNFYIWLLIGQIFFGISVVLYLPAQYSLATNFSQHRNAEIYGVIMLIKGLGFIPTGLIGGFLMERVHFLVPILIVFCALPLEIWFISRIFGNKHADILEM